MKRLLNNTFITILIALMIVIVSAIATHFINGAGFAFVKGESMQPALEDGMLTIYAKDKQVERFDIVIAHDNHSGDMVVKRVIGLPGEDIAIIEGSLYIDGKEYSEPYVHNEVNVYKREAHRIKLSEGDYYVMGDNRDNSTDSRFFGPITQDDIIGTVHHIAPRVGGK